MKNNLYLSVPSWTEPNSEIDLNLFKTLCEWDSQIDAIRTANPYQIKCTVCHEAFEFGDMFMGRDHAHVGHFWQVYQPIWKRVPVVVTRIQIQRSWVARIRAALRRFFQRRKGA